MSAFISLADARALTARFRDYREAILTESYRGQDLLPFCETFDKEQLETLLNRSGCTQLRCYYGMDEDFKVHLVLAAANADDEDILPPAQRTAETEEEDYLLEHATRCPPVCPPESDLNS